MKFRKSKTLYKDESEDLYIAFLDILGFSNSVKTNFDETINIFNRFLEALYIFYEVSPKDISLQIYSDSFILKSKELGKLITAVRILLWSTLFEDLLVRGGIGFGQHNETKSGNNFYVISKPLVYAAEVEKKIKYPCVSFHESVKIPKEYWHPGLNNFERDLLHYNGIIIVNPFNIMWGTSARYRVERMLSEYPQHSEKYEWFINLFDEVMSQKPLYINNTL